MGEPGLIVLAALAGGMSAVAAREALLSAPRAGAWVARAARPLARAGREGYAPSADEQRRLGLLGSGVILVVVVLAVGPGPLAIVAAAGPSTAAAIVARRRERYRRSVERALPDVAAAIADAISGGSSVRGALAGAASSLDGASATELARVRADIELGASTSEALTGLRRRLGSDRVDALASALVSQQIAGGDVAALMRRLGAATAERDRVADDARAATAQARFTGLLVVAMPAGAALFAELLEPGFVARVLAEPLATVLLVMAGGLQVIGFAAIRRLGRPTE